ncbi:hydrogenase maturation protease [Nonomuraea dietziae]|uniref:Hydrogenase maturation protease n=1 Tax=Nonomuraea dietziae TaxID=65515 RepID=A0A7W5YCM1_9ACTN|nr:hydrogenase maturation protease [Nonomuraea dietziae]MBB3733308.1 hydrogenase maturation protease [Nonomuraea dietziae]
MSRKVLVAGVGNVFLGDDGFGVEVAGRLLSEAGLPDGVVVADFGIRGIHLAYELLAGYDEVILVDAVPMDEPPGTLAVLEPSLDEAGPRGRRVRAGGAHRRPRHDT